MKKIVVKSIPVQYHSYYQWLILGLYELEKKQEIFLKFRLPFYQFIYFFVFNDYLRKEGFRFLSKYKLLKAESYALAGFFSGEEGEQQKFAFDIADSPFAFDKNYLISSDVYFKVQCPKIIDGRGFRLTDKVFIPYAVEVLANSNKIKPAMMGPRRLAWSIKYKLLKSAYDQYLSHQTDKKNSKLMCYFGNAKGPVVKTEITSTGNFDGEDIIMNQFANELQHPNEKRYQLFRIIRNMGADCDARVINKNGVADEAAFLTKDAVIPLKEFTGHIAAFSYNANISGFRLSIPNRFIESFMVGTAIVTDKLSVKWYRDFEAEVLELPEMGYLPMAQVDWDLIQQQLASLKELNSKKVIEQYNKHWAPEAFAQYLVSELQPANTVN